MQRDVTVVPKESRIPPRHLDAALAACPGTTVVKLAAQIGVHEVTISRWRAGTRALSRAHWLAVLAVLGLPVDWKPPKSALSAPTKRGRGRPRGSGGATSKRRPT